MLTLKNVSFVSVESSAALGRWLLLALKALVAALLLDYLVATTPISTAVSEAPPGPGVVDTTTDRDGSEPGQER